MSFAKNMLIIGLVILLIFAFYLNIYVGSVDIPFQFNFLKFTNQSFYNIMINSRLPNSFTAILSGAMLALSGLLLQANFRNILAGPSILGISTSSMLGVAVFMFFSNGVDNAFWLPFSAFLGALIVLFIILIIARKVSDIYLLIVGVMISFIASALIDVFKFTSSKSDLQFFSIWGLSSFNTTTWSQILVLLVSSVLCTVFLFKKSKQIDVFELGDELAQSMGVNIRSLRITMLFCSGIMVALVTAYCGPIAFLGMAVPQVMRIMFKSYSYKTLIPLSLLFGALLALVCDFISKLPGSVWVLPLNTATSLIGAPALIVTLLKSPKI